MEFQELTSKEEWAKILDADVEDLPDGIVYLAPANETEVTEDDIQRAKEIAEELNEV